MERAVQLFAVIHLLVIDVSHLVASESWARRSVGAGSSGSASNGRMFAPPGVAFFGLAGLIVWHLARPTG